MQINKDLCIGLFMLGFLSHYTNEEIQKYKDVQYIAKVLKSKHFDMKNGKSNDRILNNKAYVAQKLNKLSLKKKEQYEKVVIAAINRIVSSAQSFTLHGSISDKAWIRASDSFPSTNGITITASLLALLRKSPSTMKYYGFNQKKLDKINHANRFEKTLTFSSSRVATKLLQHLDEEIAHYYFNSSKAA